jgi:serine/threonine protein kinase
MGRVYRVVDLVQGGEAAIKVVRPEAQDDPGRSERFRRETAILSRLQHEAVPRVLGWGDEEGELYFVSELVLGQDLKCVLRESGPWPAERVASLGATVAEALSAAHALGIVHRDVKPGNVMLSPDGRVRLLDFGLARGVGVDMTTLTRTGTIVGTPAYMSPEQFDAFGVDGRSDLYSLGVVLFELATGRLPFIGASLVSVAIKHKTEPPPLLRSVRMGAPAWLERVVLRCLEKDPSRRYATAADLAAELRRERHPGGPRWRSLPGGDRVLEDDDSGDWALVLATSREKIGWSPGMALRFGERYYRLAAINAAAQNDDSWSYGFVPWAQGEAFRRLIDYDEDAAVRARAQEPGLGRRLRSLLSGDES